MQPEERSFSDIVKEFKIEIAALPPYSDRKSRKPKDIDRRKCRWTATSALHHLQDSDALA